MTPRSSSSVINVSTPRSALRCSREALPRPGRGGLRDQGCRSVVELSSSLQRQLSWCLWLRLPKPVPWRRSRKQRHSIKKQGEADAAAPASFLVVTTKPLLSAAALTSLLGNEAGVVLDDPPCNLTKDIHNDFS